MAHPHAGPGPADAPDTAAALCVLAGNESLLLPLVAVREVLRPLPLTRMPHAPAFLLGLCNLRGTALPVLSLRVLRGGAGAGGTSADGIGPDARIVVIAAGPARVGLLVRAVLPAGTPDAHRIDPEALLPASPGQTTPLKTSRVVDATRHAEGARDAGGARTALLGFRVGAQEFALSLDAVLSVAALGAMASGAEPAQDAMPNKVPGTDAAMLGVVPARGGLLPVLDAAVLLGLEQKQRGTRMVVARINRRAAGLAVHAVTGILRPPADAIEPVPPLLLRGLGSEARIENICRLENGRRLVQMLHPDRLLDETTMRRLAAIDADPDGDAEGMADTTAATTEQERMLLFGIGTERYALPVAMVVEVVRHPGSLARLPNAPRFIDGVMTLRGRVLPVIDGRQRFDLPANGADTGRRIVVLSTGALLLGLAVDRASEVARFAAGTLSPAPGFGAGKALFDRVATTDRGEPVLLVDPNALLDGVERDLLAAAVAASPAMPVEERAAS